MPPLCQLPAYQQGGPNKEVHQMSSQEPQGSRTTTGEASTVAALPSARALTAPKLNMAIKPGDGSSSAWKNLSNVAQRF